MNELQIFNNEQLNAKIRGQLINNEVWFVAKDVCDILNIKNSRDALTRLDDDEKGVVLTDTPSGVQEMNTINEAGFYRLILSSRKQDEQVKKFQRWVTHEVLPSIRKTGSYNLQNDSYGIGAKAVADARRIADELQQEFIGLRRGIAISKAFDLAGEMHNAPLHLLKELIPPADHDTGYLNATQIGEKLGGVPAKIVNRMLAESGLQYKDGKNWRITHTGSEYGEEMPYTKNGHSGYQIRWSNKIIPLFVKS